MSSLRGSCSEADQNHGHRNIGVRAERAGENGLCKGNNAGSVQRRSQSRVTDPRSRVSGLCPSVCMLELCLSDMGGGRLPFGVSMGDPGRANPWDLAARQRGVPPWQVPGRGSLQAGNLRMERGSSCPSSRRRGQHGVVSPGHPGPCCLRPCGVTLHSYSGLCKASDQSPLRGGITPSVCPRSHQAPRKEAPWHVPGQGSAPAVSSPGGRVLGTVLSPAPGVWLALVLGHLGLGCLGCPPAMPWGWYLLIRAPWHPRALTASVQCQRGTW